MIWNLSQGSLPRARIASVLLLFGLASCTTMGGGGGPVVVERSKKDRPAWTDLEHGKLTASGEVFRFVESRNHILNLPLGVKQVQLAAMQASRQALSQHAEEIAADFLKQKGVAAAKNDLQRQFDQHVASAHEELAKVADIYFEKYSHDAAADETLRTFYKASVLVEFPRHGLRSVIQSAAASMQKSPKLEVRQLGDSLRQLGESVHSH